jgi:hypothetical protein
MQSKSFSTILAILAISILLFTVSISAQESNDNQDDKSFFQYAAQFTCGTNPQATARVLPGQYATSVNILNAKESKTVFRKRVALTFPPPTQEGGAVSEPIVDELEPVQALKVACDEIPAEFFPDAADLPPYVHGFLIIESRTELNVTAVYTTGMAEAVESIDVEEVTGKVVKY